jgi:hypothetical protein
MFRLLFIMYTELFRKEIGGRKTGAPPPLCIELTHVKLRIVHLRDAFGSLSPGGLGTGQRAFDWSDVVNCKREG